MKQKGARYQYAEELEKELLAAYRKEKKRQLQLYGRICESLLMKNLSECPASRFYTSPEQAYVICKDIIKGKPHPKMQKTRREMYYEILSRVIELQRKQKNAPFYQLVETVCEQPAPSFYLTPGSIRFKLSKLRNKK